MSKKVLVVDTIMGRTVNVSPRTPYRKVLSARNMAQIAVSIDAPERDAMAVKAIIDKTLK